MRRIMLLATGGTIASARGEDGLAPAHTAEGLLGFVPELREVAVVEGRLLMNIDSSNMQPEDWTRIARATHEALAEFDGVVVTHGTDTMAYSSSALSFMLPGLGKPVVLTGSQRPIGETGTDAGGNMLDAVRVAAADASGVYVVFNGTIIRGCRAKKLRTRSFNAFESVNCPPAGFVEEGRVVFSAGVPPRTGEVGALAVELDPDVFLLKLIPGTRPEVLSLLASAGYRGVVVEAFGLGGLPFAAPRNLLPALEEALSAGLVVAVTTQCPYEGCDLGVYEVGVKTLRKGVIATGDMTTEAAVTKLMWALARGRDAREVKEIMLSNLCGEIST